MNAPTTLCSKPCCQVAQNGHCDLGNDPVERCPNYAQATPAAETKIEPATPSETARVEPVEICSGDVMDIDEFAAFSRRHRVRTVSLIGELSLSQTSSGWRLTENRARLSCDEGSFQVDWLDGC